jgi:plastocyanin
MGPIRGDPGAVPKVILLWTLRWALLVALGLAFVGLARPAEAPRDRGPGAAVHMTDARRFEPGQVKVRRGDTVTWQNRSSLTHTVTDDGSKARRRESWALPDGAASFDSGSVAPGGTWSHRFTVPGTYRYFCQPHEADGMNATVEVAP